MPTVVIPFSGVEGKTRLHASRRARRALSLAMLGDVLAAAVAVGAPRVVTSDDEAAAMARDLGAEIVADPGDGQGAAVAVALAGLESGAILIVNADVPCVVPEDLRAVAAATPADGIALVEALDGTTNALGLSAPAVFAPLYGPDSANRFRAHVHELGLEAVAVALPNLADDVDTLDDLERLQVRCGPRTQACLLELPVGASQ
jgi:2-phospho-L-lactate guanylyltransferase